MTAEQTENVLKAVTSLLALPNIENRVGSWTDVNKAIAELRTAMQQPLAAASPSGSMEEKLISIDQFAQAKLVTASIESVAPHPKADRLMVLQVRTGDRVRQIVAGIRKDYMPEELAGKTIIIVDNLQPAKLRGEDSFGMLLAVKLPDDVGGGLRLLTTDRPTPSGLKVS